MAFSASHHDKKVMTSCSANSLLAPNSNLTEMNSDTLIEHMQGLAREWFALWLHGLSYRKYSGRRGQKPKVGVVVRHYHCRLQCVGFILILYINRDFISIIARLRSTKMW